jgi:DNA-binding response OmpR family regulator
MSNVLVVDDEPGIRDVFSKTLESFYEVTTTATGEEALTILTSETRVDVVLLDLNLPGIGGLELLDAIQSHSPATAVIMITGCGSIETAVHAMRRGSVNYLQKPISADVILKNVREAVQHARRERERNAILQKARQLLERGLRELEQVAPPRTDLLADSDDADPARFIQKGPLLIDTYQRKSTLDGELLDLTTGEYDLLLCLAREAPRVLDPLHLVKETRGFECSLNEAREIIRWQVYLLRQKVETDPSDPKYVLNVRGKGYMWAAI